MVSRRRVAIIACIDHIGPAPQLATSGTTPPSPPRRRQRARRQAAGHDDGPAERHEGCRGSGEGSSGQQQRGDAERGMGLWLPEGNQVFPFNLPP